MRNLSRAEVQGLIWASLAVVIWSGSVVALRQGMVTDLNAYDLTALRFGTAAPLLLVVILRQVDVLRRVGLIRLCVITTCFGAPYIMVFSAAIGATSAATAGALNPGAMAVFATLIGAMFSRRRVGRTGALGIAAIIAGVCVIVDAQSGGLTRGHVLLIVTGGMWATYAVFIQTSGIPALLATSVVAVGSAVFYLPLYVTVLPRQISDASLQDVAMQMTFQGVLVSLVAVYAFNRSIELLGLRVSGVLPALIPLVCLALGAMFLGEFGGQAQIFAALVIGAGVALILTPGRARA